MIVGRRTPLAVGVIAVIAIGAAVLWRGAALRPHSAGSETLPAATYVGAESCAGCHRDAYDAWRKSQHHASMQPATSTSVKGRFDGNQFKYDSVVSTFSERDGRYWVRTDGADGKLADFEIKYTFGVYPLQQYLIELSD